MLARFAARAVVRRTACAASAAAAGAISMSFRAAAPATLFSTPTVRAFAVAAASPGLTVFDESKAELSALTKGKAIVYYTAG